MKKQGFGLEQLFSSKFREMEFEGAWLEFVGKPELSGSWFVWGNSGNGKTAFACQLAKYLSQFERVAYDSLEEGFSKSLKLAFENANINSKDNILPLDKEPISLLKERLIKKKSPRIIIIDSFQYTGLTKEGYKELITEFATKLFIFISHADGKKPAGRVANTVHYDSNVKIFIEGFKAFAKSRYGGGVPYTIWEKGAEEYWVSE